MLRHSSTRLFPRQIEQIPLVGINLLSQYWVPNAITFAASEGEQDSFEQSRIP